MTKKLFILPVALLLASCQISILPPSSSSVDSSKQPTISSSATNDTVQDSVDADSSLEETQSSSQNQPASSIIQKEQSLSRFFEYGSNARIDIEGTDEVFEFISERQGDSDRKYADAYLPVNVVITLDQTEYRFEEVGMRMKGNTSRRRFFQNGEFVDRAHFKLNFKYTFDSALFDDPLLAPFKHDWSADAAGRKQRKDRSFLGLDKLDIKYVARNMDGCYLRELYAYQAFREADIPAPYANIVKVKFSGESSVYEADYEAIEPIDKGFLKRRFGKDEAKGDLYKCVYNGMGKADLTRDGAVDRSTGLRVPYGKIGVEENYVGYAPVYQLKTNDDLGENSDFSAMADFIVTLRDCVYEGAGIETLNAILDVDEFLRMSAVSYLLGNFDDQRYNYNNYYLYFRPSDHKAIILPYDWDWCLGLDVTGRLSTSAPLDRWTLDGGNLSNLYLATFLGETTSYAQDDMKTKYMDYVSAEGEKILDFGKYEAFAAIFSQNDSEETSSVRSYMAEKSRAYA